MYRIMSQPPTGRQNNLLIFKFTSQNRIKTQGVGASLFLFPYFSLSFFLPCSTLFYPSLFISLKHYLVFSLARTFSNVRPPQTRKLSSHCFCSLKAMVPNFLQIGSILDGQNVQIFPIFYIKWTPVRD